MQGEQGAAAALERSPPYAAGPWIQAQNSPSVDTLCNSCCIRHAWPGGSRGSVHPGSGCSAGACATASTHPFTGGRHDQVGTDEQWHRADRAAAAHQRPRRAAGISTAAPACGARTRRRLDAATVLGSAHPAAGSVVFKSAVASLLEPAAALLSQYGEESKQEVPQAASPLERLKQAFQDFTDSFEGG